MIKTILVSIETGLLKLVSWDGWTDQDRTFITDIHRQVGHLKRRHARREADMQRSTMSRSGR